MPISTGSATEVALRPNPRSMTVEKTIVDQGFGETATRSPEDRCFPSIRRPRSRKSALRKFCGLATFLQGEDGHGQHTHSHRQADPVAEGKDDRIVVHLAARTEQPDAIEPEEHQRHDEPEPA